MSLASAPASPLHALKLQLVAIATGELEVRENTSAGKIAITQYQGRTTLAPGEWPWCAAFMCWVLDEALRTRAGKDYLASIGMGRDTFRCRSARAFDWVKWGQRLGLNVTDENERALRGDLVIYDFSHIGLVVEDQKDDSRIIATIEGNTNEKGGRDGDGVYKKLRKTNLVKAYVRLPSRIVPLASKHLP